MTKLFLKTSGGTDKESQQSRRLTRMVSSLVLPSLLLLLVRRPDEDRDSQSRPSLGRSAMKHRSQEKRSSQKNRIPLKELDFFVPRLPRSLPPPSSEAVKDSLGESLNHIIPLDEQIDPLDSVLSSERRRHVQRQGLVPKRKRNKKKVVSSSVPSSSSSGLSSSCEWEKALP